jgi:hypothetical protein
MARNQETREIIWFTVLIAILIAVILAGKHWTNWGVFTP